MAVRVHRLGRRGRADLSLDPLLSAATRSINPDDEKTGKSPQVLKVRDDGDVWSSLFSAGRKKQRPGGLLFSWCRAFACHE